MSVGRVCIKFDIRDGRNGIYRKAFGRDLGLVGGGVSVAQLEEIVLLPGVYRMRAGFVNTVGVELEPGVVNWPSAGAAGR